MQDQLLGYCLKMGCLVGENNVTSKLLQTSTSTEKMYKIDDHVACAVAGIMSDANILINTARVQARRYAYAHKNQCYQEPMPVEQLVQSLCDTKQGALHTIWWASSIWCFVSLCGLGQKLCFPALYE